MPSIAVTGSELQGLLVASEVRYAPSVVRFLASSLCRAVSGCVRVSPRRFSIGVAHASVRVGCAKRGR